MSRPAALLLALTALVTVLLPGDLVRAGRVSPSHLSAGGEQTILVRLHASLDVLDDDALSARLGGTVTARLRALSTVALAVNGDESLDDAIGRVEDVKGVVDAEPNYAIRDAAAPEDPLYPAQAPYLSLVGAEAAWEMQTGSATIKVAVLDSGVDLAHPDLEGAIWQNPGETPNNGIDDDGNGCIDDINGCSFFAQGTVDPSCEVPASPNVVDDDFGHGTFVAGIIGARANNGLGVSGVAPGVTILPVKILDCMGNGTVLDAALGIMYAAESGARVANLSFSTDGDSSVLAAAIREAHDTYGMLIVAATGNTGGPAVRFPARMPEALAVASSGYPGGDADARSPFSDWGAQVAVAAPGVSIVSTVPERFCSVRWLCLQDQSYAVASGTSFAAPIVSSLAALILSEAPDMSADLVREVIVDTAEDLPDNGETAWDGAGRVRIDHALAFVRYYLDSINATNAAALDGSDAQP
jgi:subtilisin family serine protease